MKFWGDRYNRSPQRKWKSKIIQIAIKKDRVAKKENLVEVKKRSMTVFVLQALLENSVEINIKNPNFIYGNGPNFIAML